MILADITINTDPSLGWVLGFTLMCWGFIALFALGVHLFYSWKDKR